jgi:hypothetical protein
MIFGAIAAVFDCILTAAFVADADWMTRLVAFGFGSVGVLLSIGTAHEALGYLNPNIALGVSDTALPPGGRLVLKWSCPAHRSPFQLRITLEGKETSSNPDDDDVSYEAEEFAKIVAVDIDDPDKIIDGHAEFQLPQRLMHSFESGNNQITWTLRVFGKTPWTRPNIDETYPFFVTPEISTRNRFE